MKAAHIKTLQRSGNPLALPQVQLATLGDPQLIPAGHFEKHLSRQGLGALRSRGIEVLQINVGRVCNQTCAHCHVDAGPDRRESMTRATVEQVVELLDQPAIQVLDITGGARRCMKIFAGWWSKLGCAASGSSIAVI